MSSPSPAALAFVRVAVVGGAALVALTLLWLSEVITLPVFIVGLVVVTTLEGLAMVRVVRRQQARSASPDHTGVTPTHPAPTSAPDGRVDTTAPYRETGYDPMDGLPGIGGGRTDDR